MPSVRWWIDLRDLAQVIEHAGPLPHPVADQLQKQTTCCTKTWLGGMCNSAAAAAMSASTPAPRGPPPRLARRRPRQHARDPASLAGIRRRAGRVPRRTYGDVLV